MSSDADLLRRALAVPAARFEERAPATSRACRRLGAEGRAAALARLRQEAAARAAPAGRDAAAVLAGVGVEVRDVVEGEWFADAYVTAYDGRARSVEVNVRLVDRVETFLARLGVAPLDEPGLLRRVGVAHELSHHLDWPTRRRRPCGSGSTAATTSPPPSPRRRR